VPPKCPSEIGAIFRLANEKHSYCFYHPYGIRHLRAKSEKMIVGYSCSQPQSGEDPLHGSPCDK
jgi:hypothetical protein